MIKRSELITNRDGSLYHLFLLPGEIAETIITVGDPERVGQVSQYFDEIELIRENREFITHTGWMKGKRLSVISTGIGTDNIDIVINELHSLFNSDLSSGEKKATHTRLNFIRMGTSGAVREDIPVDTLLASEAALGFDGLLHFYKYDEGSQKIMELLENKPAFHDLPRPYFAEADEELIHAFKSVYSHKGVTATAPGFYAPQGRNINAAPKLINFTGLLSESSVGNIPVTNIEMETAGIYGLAWLLGHKAISLSAILANRITGEFSQKPAKTVDMLIQKSLEVIVKLI